MTPPHCEHAEEQIQRALDGPDELSADERRALDAHLDACAACRRAQGEYRRLRAMTDDWLRRAQPPAASTPEFTAAVLACVAAAAADATDAAEVAGRRRRAAAVVPSPRRLPAVFAAVLVLVAAALWPFVAPSGGLGRVASAVAARTAPVALPGRVAAVRPLLPPVPRAEALREAPTDVAESLRALSGDARRVWDDDVLRAAADAARATALPLPVFWAVLAATAALLNAGFFVRAARQNQRGLAG
jgi:hypothetical protein